MDANVLGTSEKRYITIRSSTTGYGHTTLQTVNLRQPCFQCRWSSLLQRSTRLSKVTTDISFGWFRQQLNTADIDSYQHYSSALEAL